MTEVDYSRFIYQPNCAKPPSDDKRKREKKRKSGGKKVFTVIIAVVLCFAILFFCVDFFAKGSLTEGIYSLMRKTGYSYYAVCRSYPTRETAHAGALLAENGGGAGYLFSENGDYYVIFGIFAEKTDAQSVASKNSDTFIYSLSYSTTSTDIAGLIDSFVRDMSIYLDNVDDGTFTENSLAMARDDYIVLFSSYEPKNDKETSLVSFILSCLDEIAPGTTERASLLFRTRHMLCSVLFAARETFS